VSRFGFNVREEECFRFITEVDVTMGANVRSFVPDDEE